MSEIEYIKDIAGTVIGQIVRNGTTSHAYDKNGRYVGQYLSDSKTTFGKDGRPMCRGDALESTIWRENN